MPDLPVLGAEDQRVLGVLLEKQVAVPASYPLSLNALRAACNQTSSRDPVVEYDDETLELVVRDLRHRGLLRVVWTETGRRTLRYHQLLDEVLALDEAERALATVLLLRGAQTPGELRSRTERLHAFADRDDVEATLRRMAARPEPLVRELERRPGQHDHRWLHLLGAPSEAAAPAPSEPAAHREGVLRGGVQARDARVRAAYDVIAEPYAAAVVTELEQLPFESWLIDRVAREAPGPVVDVGCGPGHVTAHLAAVGAEASGLDVSAAMVEQARGRFPAGSYGVGDLRRLMRPDTAPGWGAVVAWFSLIHLADSELDAAVAALARPLAPGGLLALALHAGSQTREVSTWFGHEVDVDVLEHEPDAVADVLTRAGLAQVEWYRRGPLTARAETGERLYLLARAPAAG